MKRSAVTIVVVALATAPAQADDRAHLGGQFALLLDGAEGGVVHSVPSSDGAKKTLVVSTNQPTPAVIGVVRAFLDGKAAKKSLVLSTPAIVQKASDARLVDVRLPSYAGAANDLSLTFEVASTSSSPSFRTVSDKARSSGSKLASFRLALGDLPTNEATRLDSLSVKNKEGAATADSLTFDVPSRDAPAFLAWGKKRTARDGAIEYVSPTGEVVLGVKVGGCTASSTKIDGPITHVVVSCTRARSSG